MLTGRDDYSHKMLIASKIVAAGFQLTSLNLYGKSIYSLTMYKN